MEYKDTNVYVTTSHAFMFTNKQKHLSCNKNVVIFLKQRIHQQYGYRFSLPLFHHTCHHFPLILQRNNMFNVETNHSPLV